mgnify:CR=1 FL=1
MAMTSDLVSSTIVARSREPEGLRKMMIVAPLLVLAQITLGIYVVLTFRSVPVAVAHFAGAVSLWGLWVSAWMMTSLADRVDAGAGNTIALEGAEARA